MSFTVNRSCCWNHKGTTIDDSKPTLTIMWTCLGVSISPMAILLILDFWVIESCDLSF